MGKAKQGELIPERRDWNCLGIILSGIPSLRDSVTGELFTTDEVARCLSAFSLAISDMQRELREQAQEIKRLRPQEAQQ